MNGGVPASLQQALPGAVPHLIQVGRPGLGGCVRLFVIHHAVLANVDQALKDFDQFQGDIQGDGDEVAIQDEAGHKGIACHHPRAIGVCGAVAVIVWTKVPGVQRELPCRSGLGTCGCSAVTGHSWLLETLPDLLVNHMSVDKRRPAPSVMVSAGRCQQAAVGRGANHMVEWEHGQTAKMKAALMPHTFSSSADERYSCRTRQLVVHMGATQHMTHSEMWPAAAQAAEIAAGQARSHPQRCHPPHVG